MLQVDKGTHADRSSYATDMFMLPSSSIGIPLYAHSQILVGTKRTAVGASLNCTLLFFLAIQTDFKWPTLPQKWQIASLEWQLADLFPSVPHL